MTPTLQLLSTLFDGRKWCVRVTAPGWSYDPRTDGPDVPQNCSPEKGVQLLIHHSTHLCSYSDACTQVCQCSPDSLNLLMRAPSGMLWLHEWQSAPTTPEVQQ